MEEERLYRHQEAAVMRMEEMEKEQHQRLKDNDVLFSRLGIYADRRGTGRRRSVMTLVARDRRSWDTAEPYVLEMIQDVWGDGQVIRRRTRRLRRVRTTLIVCHRSSLRSWEKETALSGLCFRLLRTRKDLVCVDGDVVICQAGLLPALIECTRGLAWKRVVLDGRVQKTVRPITGFTWCLWPEPCVVPGLCAELLRHVVVRSPERDVCLSMSLAPARYATYHCLPLCGLASFWLAMDRVVRYMGGASTADDAADKNCVVCLDRVIEPVLTRCCGSAYCGSCLLQWLRRRWTCPACRSDLSPSMLLTTRQEKPEHPTRIELLRSLAENTKLVVVATVPVDRIEGCVPWTESLGSAVLSTHDLVLYHPLPLGTVARITGRFHCIGRQKPLTVHCLEDAPSRAVP